MSGRNKANWRRLAMAIIAANRDCDWFLFSEWADFLADFSGQHTLLDRLRDDCLALEEEGK